MKTLYIIRGLPGSGKSTIAKKLVSSDRHFEADMYFTSAAGNYVYDVNQISAAHDWCMARIARRMATSTEDCAVANTFIQRHHYQPYIDLARSLNWDYVVIDCHGNWDNIHGVPKSTLAKMSANFQPHPTRSIQ